MPKKEDGKKYIFTEKPHMGRGGILHTDFWWSMLPDHEKVNKSLLSEIATHKSEEPDTQILSNPGCWRGHRKYNDWSYIRDFAIHKLKIIHNHYIGIGAPCASLDNYSDDRFEFENWTNVNQPGSGNTMHTHSKWHWSGVYYVQGRDTGKIAFYSSPYLNQQVTKGLPFGQSFTVEPVDGLMVIFPSYLLHEVLTNPSEKDRINLVFNVKIDL